MESLWQRLEGWLAEHWPAGLHSLNPPATDAQIAALEAALGVKLPDDYLACLRIHNGQNLDVAGGLFPCGDFLSCDDVLDQWAIWKDLVDCGEFDGIASDPQAGIRPDWFKLRWIPFTHDRAGNHHCLDLDLDLDPADGGHAGQIVTMWHDSAERELIAPDFTSWFTSFAKGVFSGRYVYAYGSIVDARDADSL